MQFRFLGATGGAITGSCTHFLDNETGVQFLVDCGVTQGEPGASSWNQRAFEFDAFEISFVVLTHAHQDHCGLIPRLYKEGFTGLVYCTQATARLARLALLDSVKYSGGKISTADVDAIRFYAIDSDGADGINQAIKVSSNIELTFAPSAHLVGACHVTIIWRDRAGESRSMVMSGDIGNNLKDDCWQSLLAPRQPIPGYVNSIVVESTYGGRVRDTQYRSKAVRHEAIRKLISEKLIDGRLPIVLPAFAMQRTQEVLLDLILVIKNHFSGENSPQVRNADDPWFARSIEKGFWTAPQFEILTSTISSFGDEYLHIWREITEPFTSETAFGIRVKQNASAAYKELADKLLKSYSPFQIDIVLSSPLALEMGRVLADELCQRSPDDSGDRAYRNSSLMTDFNFSSEDDLDHFIRAAFELNASALPTPHRLIFAPEHKMPRKYLRSRHGTIFLTGGGMCDGGPVVGLLESLIADQVEFAFAPTGYMAKGSLGGRLLEVAKSDMTISSPEGDAMLTVGESQFPVSSVKLEISDLAPFYSGHADQDGLLNFVFSMGEGGPRRKRYPTRVFINHGNTQAREALKAQIEARIDAPHGGDREISEVLLPPKLPRWYDLDAGLWTDDEFIAPQQALLKGLLRQQIQTNQLLKQLLEQQAQRPDYKTNTKTGKQPTSRKTA